MARAPIVPPSWPVPPGSPPLGGRMRDGVTAACSAGTVETARPGRPSPASPVPGRPAAPVEARRQRQAGTAPAPEWRPVSGRAPASRAPAGPRIVPAAEGRRRGVRPRASGAAVGLGEGVRAGGFGAGRSAMHLGAGGSSTRRTSTGLEQAWQAGATGGTGSPSATRRSGAARAAPPNRAAPTDRLDGIGPLYGPTSARRRTESARPRRRAPSASPVRRPRSEPRCPPATMTFVPGAPSSRPQRGRRACRASPRSGRAEAAPSRVTVSVTGPRGLQERGLTARQVRRRASAGSAARATRA